MVSSSGVVTSGVCFCLEAFGVFLLESDFVADCGSFSDAAGVEVVADCLAGVAPVSASLDSCLISTTTGILLADFADKSNEDLGVDFSVVLATGFSGALATDFTGVLGVMLRGFGDDSVDMARVDDDFLGVVLLPSVDAAAIPFSETSATPSGVGRRGEVGSNFTLTL